jgi:chromosome segregation ATPase
MFANCPKDLAVAFQNAYSDGNTLKKDIDAKAEKLKNAERYLGEKERELQSIENQMKKMRARINENEDAIQRLSREIEQQKSRSLQGHDSFAKSRLNENQNKKDQLKRENNNISRFDLPNLVQQRQLNSFDVAKAREEILHWEEQLTKLKLKAQKNAR